MMTFRSFDTSDPSSSDGGDKGVLDNAITVVMSARFKLSRMTSVPTNPVAPATMSFMIRVQNSGLIVEGNLRPNPLMARVLK